MKLSTFRESCYKVYTERVADLMCGESGKRVILLVYPLWEGIFICLHEDGSSSSAAAQRQRSRPLRWVCQMPFWGKLSLKGLCRLAACYTAMYCLCKGFVIVGFLFISLEFSVPSFVARIAASLVREHVTECSSLTLSVTPRRNLRLVQISLERLPNPKLSLRWNSWRMGTGTNLLKGRGRLMF